MVQFQCISEGIPLAPKSLDCPNELLKMRQPEDYYSSHTASAEMDQENSERLSSIQSTYPRFTKDFKHPLEVSKVENHQ